MTTRFNFLSQGLSSALVQTVPKSSVAEVSKRVVFNLSTEKKKKVNFKSLLYKFLKDSSKIISDARKETKEKYPHLLT